MWGAKPPTFLDGSKAPRGRPDPKNRPKKNPARLPSGTQNKVVVAQSSHNRTQCILINDARRFFGSWARIFNKFSAAGGTTDVTRPIGANRGHSAVHWQLGILFFQVFGRLSAKLGPKTSLERRGSSCSADCTKNQPPRPILIPFRGNSEFGNPPPPPPNEPLSRTKNKKTSLKCASCSIQ